MDIELIEEMDNEEFTTLNESGFFFDFENVSDQEGSEEGTGETEGESGDALSTFGHVEEVSEPVGSVTYVTAAGADPEILNRLDNMNHTLNIMLLVLLFFCLQMIFKSIAYKMKVVK